MDSGWVYILTNRSLKSDYLKIGRTKNEPSSRASELSSVTGVATPFNVAYSEAVPDCVRAEHLVHLKLANYRVNDKREFFQIDLSAAQMIVQDTCEIVRKESILCRQCKANIAKDEIERIRDELQKQQNKLRHLQKRITIFAFLRNYISIVLSTVEKGFQKIVPEKADRRIFIWGLLMPLCIVGWIVLFFIFTNIAVALVYTVMLLAAIMVIGSTRTGGRSDSD